MSLLSEVRRRNVFKVALAYAAVCWLLIQVVTAIEEPLGLPDWFDTFVIVLLVIGFPVALLLAWAFQLTPEGLKPDAGAAGAETITRGTGQVLNRITIGVLALAVAFLLIDRFMPGTGDFPPAETAAAAASHVTAVGPVIPSRLPDSIAVLPFENLSPDADDAFFAAGLHEEILNQLVKIRNLTVIARTTMRQYAGTNKPLVQIADELKVQAIMEGSVRYARDRVRVTAQLIDPSTGGHLWSDTYERAFDDVFAIESDIAMNVANAMAVEFSPAEQERLQRIPTESRAAYEQYLAARAYLRRGTPGDLLLAIERIDRALDLDPRFVLAWALKADIHWTGVTFLPEQAREQGAAAAEAAARAFELGPNVPEVHRVLAMVAILRGDIREALTQRDRAVELGMRSEEIDWVAIVGSFGYSMDAYEGVLRWRATDPLNPTGAFWLVSALDAIGESDAALAEYERGLELYDNWGVGDFAALETLLGSRDHDRAMQLVRTRLLNNPYDRGVLAAFLTKILAASDSPEVALDALRDYYAQPAYTSPIYRQYIAAFAAYFGDPALALAAVDNAMNDSMLISYQFWKPLLAEVRQLDEFKAVMQRRGYVEYWRAEGWPDQCRPVGNDDFECH